MAKHRIYGLSLYKIKKNTKKLNEVTGEWRTSKCKIVLEALGK